MQLKGKENPRFKDRTGERWKTNEGCWVTIIEYFSSKNCIIRFDTGVVLNNIRYDCVAKGVVSNPYNLSVFGVGYIGEGEYNSTDSSFSTWYSMFRRCYDEKSHKSHPTYKTCSVSPKWHCFQNYAQWYHENHKEGWQMDKDIKIKGNKTYSPETCCFVPHEINMIFREDKVRDLPRGVKKSGRKYQAISCGKNLGTFNTSEEASFEYEKVRAGNIKDKAEYWKYKVEDFVYNALLDLVR